MRTNGSGESAPCGSCAVGRWTARFRRCTWGWAQGACAQLTPALGPAARLSQLTAARPWAVGWAGGNPGETPQVRVLCLATSRVAVTRGHIRLHLWSICDVNKMSTVLFSKY